MNPDNARILRITAAAGTELADACSRGTFLRTRVTACSPPPKQFTTRRAVFLHAAWLGQGCPHCPIVLTAASRRSLDRSQFQCGGPVLSEPLPIVGLVGRYPANCLMGRVPILYRVAALVVRGCPRNTLWDISTSFPVFCPCTGQVAHVLRTRTPLVTKALLPRVTVRLACIKPAASVHPEPGSNSPLYLSLFCFCLFRAFDLFCLLCLPK